MRRVSPTHPQDDTTDTLQVPRRQSLCGVLSHSISCKCLFLTMMIVLCLTVIVWCRVSKVSKISLNLFPYHVTRQEIMVSNCSSEWYLLAVVALCLFYPLYLIECYMNPLRTQLKRSVPESEVVSLVGALRGAQPVIWWKAHCYHYVSRYRDLMHGRPQHTPVLHERINTHSAGYYFRYDNWGVRDGSKKLVHLTSFPFTRVRFSKGFAFMHIDAATDFEEQRTNFFHSHERRDHYMEMREGLDFSNVKFKETMTVRRNSGMPWYTHPVAYYLASLLLLALPLRMLIESNTGRVHYQITKLFGTNNQSGEVTDDGQSVSRTSMAMSADSAELESSIAQNCTVAPSYSEAILMINSNSFTATTRNPSTNGVLPAASTAGVPASVLLPPPPPPPVSHQMVVYFHPSPLPPHRPEDPYQTNQNSWIMLNGHAPPRYEEAIEFSEPFSGLDSDRCLRRSHTERNFKMSSTPSRLLYPRRSFNYAYNTSYL